MGDGQFIIWPYLESDEAESRSNSGYRTCCSLRQPGSPLPLAGRSWLALLSPQEAHQQSDERLGCLLQPELAGGTADRQAAATAVGSAIVSGCQTEGRNTSTEPGDRVRQRPSEAPPETRPIPKGDAATGLAKSSAARPLAKQRCAAQLHLDISRERRPGTQGIIAQVRMAVDLVGDFRRSKKFRHLRFRLGPLAAPALSIRRSARDGPAS